MWSRDCGDHWTAGHIRWYRLKPDALPSRPPNRYDIAMPIIRIVPGGHTGADCGGLDAAVACGIPHGGWCPEGRRAEDGIIPAKYQLQEMPSKDYLKRTEANVVDSDATLVFTLGRLSGGSLRTVEYAHGHEKPWLHIDVGHSSREQAVKSIVDWLQGRGEYDHDEYTAQPPAECLLNIAGSRESKADGMRDLVQAIVVDVLREVNDECRGLYPLP